MVATGVALQHLDGEREDAQPPAPGDLGSSARRPPEAAFRGFAKSGSPASSRSRLTRSKLRNGM